MGIELENRGCLSCLNPSIELNDLLSVQGATNRDEAVRLWDSVTDWFCGTNKAEAIRLLFDISSGSTSNSTKVNSFYALKELAGDGYKNRFMIDILPPIGVIYKLAVETNDCATIEFRARFSEHPRPFSENLSRVLLEGFPLPE